MELHLRTPLAIALLTGAVAILSPASIAGAETIHQHVRLPDSGQLLERVVQVAPPDSDQDGVANADDRCPSTAAATSDGCPAPAPIVSTYAPTIAPTATSTTTSSGGYTIPAGIVACESGGNYSAVNPSSGAGGAYQIMPSTWRLYGQSGAPQDAPPALQDQVAAQIWADSGASAWSCAQ